MTNIFDNIYNICKILYSTLEVGSKNQSNFFRKEKGMKHFFSMLAAGILLSGCGVQPDTLGGTDLPSKIETQEVEILEEEKPTVPLEEYQDALESITNLRSNLAAAEAARDTALRALDRPIIVETVPTFSAAPTNSTLPSPPGDLYTSGYGTPPEWESYGGSSGSGSSSFESSFPSPPSNPWEPPTTSSSYTGNEVWEDAEPTPAPTPTALPEPEPVPTQEPTPEPTPEPTQEPVEDTDNIDPPEIPDLDLPQPTAPESPEPSDSPTPEPTPSSDVVGEVKNTDSSP